MIVSMERYTDLLRQFEQISKTRIRGDALETLKRDYKDEINSKRVLETIVDIKTLLKVLEKRGVLQYDDISVLEQIARRFLNYESVEELFLEYKQWLQENSSLINNLYSCGKSTSTLTCKKCNAPQISVIEKSCDENLLLLNKTEEQCNVNNRAKSPNNRTVEPLEVTCNHNNYLSSIYIKYFDKHKKKNLITLVFISLLLLIILIGIIWILVDLSYRSLAIVPRANFDNRQTLGAGPGSEMQFYASNINVGISVDPRTVPNQNQYNPTAAPLPNVNREQQLQALIVRKVGKKIGKFWRDVSRRLNIEESDIERIEKIYYKDEHGDAKMFEKALELYFSENNLNWEIKLMNALELSRRKDLKDIVYELIHQKNF